ncbi:MAG: PilN domain-containing protein [Phycisphaerae bacterium]|nr:PilN domain-containing protein [Phycisphaerae bacterium]
MLHINFVPDEYVQSKDSTRTNLMYLMLLGVVMLGLGSSFMAIKLKQNRCKAEEQQVDQQMYKAKEEMLKFQELQAKRKVMLKTALMTSELLEPVGRSVLMAALTNKLPAGTSFLSLKMEQKKPKIPVDQITPAAESSKYSSIKQQLVSKEKNLETHIEIEGLAPSDLQVAEYIKKLIETELLENVSLVESREKNIDDINYRHFKLTAMLNKKASMDSGDIEKLIKEVSDSKSQVSMNTKGEKS